MEKKAFLCLGISILMPALAVHAQSVIPKDSVVNLQEIVISDNFSQSDVTPLSMTTLTPSRIRAYASAPNYVDMLQGIPGLYATSQTGTYGDATLNMRGFKQDNIAVMLNGIPIQGLTSGSMYWSNWMGLAEATYSVQVQKGMGASMLTDCAMGGMVNIITKTGEGLPEWNASASFVEYGTWKGMLSYSSGQTKHGWNTNLMVSGVIGDGYVEASEVKSISYLLSVSKILDRRNTLTFTALGSPEQHDQRNTELSKDEIDKYGRGYSKNWGMLNGEKYSIARNHYFKPYFTLQHHLDKGALTMKNSLYLAIADGGGRSTYNDRTKPAIIAHQTADGHIDFNSVIAENSATGQSHNIMLDYLSGHTQAGAVISADYTLDDSWKTSAGLQYQYYDTWSKMEILDLLGGSSFHDSSTGKDLVVGDCIGAQYGRTTHHASAYGQILYDGAGLHANLGVSVFNGNYRRHNDITGQCSDWAYGWGATVKGGLLYHSAAPNMDWFLNLGYNSRLPYASAYLASSDLSVTNDMTNEENLMAEFGTRAYWKGGQLQISGYAARWNNRTLTVSIAKRANEAAQKYQITGLNAMHMGLEIEASQQIGSMTVRAFANLASWKWASSGNALIYDGYTNETLNRYTIYCDGLHVGDSPQTQIGAEMEYRLPKGFAASVQWQFNDRMYADFEPQNRTSQNSADAYRFPSWNVFDARFGWNGQVAEDVNLDISLSGRNLTDTVYIERGIDGLNNDLETFRGYWGAPRTISLAFKLTF